MNNYSNYFDLRNISQEFYSDYQLPLSIKKVLPPDKNISILDIGCGLGSTLESLKREGYADLTGIDVSDQAIQYCLNKGYEVINSDILNFTKKTSKKYDFIIMSHVLEHIEKRDIIKVLEELRNKLLNARGSLYVAVPNAQSNTGSYWAYEDFTHHTLFTTGSLTYVLKASGFNSIKFIDPKGIEGSNIFKKTLKLIFLKIYDLKNNFWNRITSSSYHTPSQRIYTFDIKVVAKSDI